MTLAGELRQLLFHLRCHRFAEAAVGGDEDGRGKFVVLRLGEQVGGQMGGGAAAVVDDEDLGRTGNHVDADLAEDQLLGGGHVDVARPGDLVDPGDGGRAVGQRRHRLGAADPEDPVNPGKTGGGKHVGIDLPAGSRHHHDHFRHACHPGRNGVHDHAGGVARLAARDIDADPLQRRDHLAEHDIALFRRQPGLLLLLLVKARHPLDRQLQGGDVRVAAAGKGLVDLVGGNLQSRYRCGFQPVEALRVLKHGGITARSGPRQ